jgi:hypothetical protein
MTGAGDACATTTVAPAGEAFQTAIAPMRTANAAIPTFLFTVSFTLSSFGHDMTPPPSQTLV